MMDNNSSLNESMGFLVGRAARIMAIRLNRNFAQAGYDVNVDHWIVLCKLLSGEGLNQRDLSVITGRDKTAITRLIDHMESKNLLNRVPDKNDRRNKLLYLTNAGKALREELEPIVKKSNEEAEAGIDEDQLAICKNVLDRIFQNGCQEFSINKSE